MNAQKSKEEIQGKVFLSKTYVIQLVENSKFWYFCLSVFSRFARCQIW